MSKTIDSLHRGHGVRRTLGGYAPHIASRDAGPRNSYSAVNSARSIVAPAIKTSPQFLNLDDAALAAYQQLFEQVRGRLPGGEPQTIALTSACRGEAKTTTAVNLAFAASFAGPLRTLVVDANMQRPGTAERLGVSSLPGLSNVILDGMMPEQAIAWVGPAGIAVLPAGQPITNPDDLLGGRRMGMLLWDLKQQYDLIILDGPPVTSLDQAAALVRFCDAVFFVVQMRKTRRQVADHALGLLHRAGANVQGCILTHDGNLAEMEPPETETAEMCQSNDVEAFASLAVPPARLSTESDVESCDDPAARGRFHDLQEIIGDGEHAANEFSVRVLSDAETSPNVFVQCFDDPLPSSKIEVATVAKTAAATDALDAWGVEDTLDLSDASANIELPADIENTNLADSLEAISAFDLVPTDMPRRFEHSQHPDWPELSLTDFSLSASAECADDLLLPPNPAAEINAANHLTEDAAAALIWGTDADEGRELASSSTVIEPQRPKQLTVNCFSPEAESPESSADETATETDFELVHSDSASDPSPSDPDTADPSIAFDADTHPASPDESPATRFTRRLYHSNRRTAASCDAEPNDSWAGTVLGICGALLIIASLLYLAVGVVMCL